MESMLIKKSYLKTIKKVGIGFAILLFLVWLSMTLAIELLQRRERTLDLVAGIDSIKHWFIVMRLSIYLSIYFGWRYILIWLKPDISESRVVYGRRMLVRVFIAYELMFGINIIAWITH